MESLFSQRLKEARLNKGLTLQQLAKDVGSTKATLSKYEHGVAEPKLMLGQKLSRRLGVPIDWLSGLTNENVISQECVFESLNNEDKKEAMRYMQYLNMVKKGDDQQSATLEREEVS